MGSFSDNITVVSPSGAATSTDPDIEIPRKATIQHAALVILSPDGSGPVLASISLFPRGHRFGSEPLKTGWIRSPTDVNDSDALFWDGEITLKADGVLEATIRNDTGTEVTLRLHVTGFQ